MPYIPEEVLAEVKQVDLLTYLQNCDPDELVRENENRYHTQTHDSLIISNGKWHWTSHNAGGTTALQYLILVRGMNLPEAAQAILDSRAAPGWVELPSSPAPKMPFQLPKRHENTKEVMKYLHARGIADEILSWCVRQGILYESTPYHNCVFVGRDDSGTARFASMRGIWSDFKKEAESSNKAWAFHIPAEGNSTELALYESSIDLLSGATLDLLDFGNWRSVHRVDLSGTSPLAANQYLLSHPEIRAIILCLDNDDAGWRTAAKLKRYYEARGYRVQLKPPPRGKDYNVYLRFRQTRARMRENIACPSR